MKPLNESSSRESGGRLFLAMPTCPAPQTFGFSDVELRVQWLLTKGNPLSRLDTVLDWELFRPLLDAALDQSAKGPGGRSAPRPVEAVQDAGGATLLQSLRRADGVSGQ